MSDYLLVSDEVPRLSEGDRPNAAWGLARGLLARQHRVTILTCAAGDVAGRIPGLARRLRTVTGTTPTETRQLGLYEGRFAAADPQLLVVDVDADSSSARAPWLGAAAAALAADGLVKADVLVGWGESSAIALERVPATAKFFVLPDGLVGGSQARDPGAGDEAGALAAIGAMAAQAVVVPSPAAARALEAHPALAARASDEPIVPIRFGSDEPPFDPGADSELPAVYSAAAPAGKHECRRALARQLGLALGPRTLVLAVAPLRERGGGSAAVEAIATILDRDVCVVASSEGDRQLVERMRILSIENPTKVALQGRAPTHARDDRRVLAGVDALLLPDADDFTGRPAGRALRYGTVPVGPLGSALADLLVDVDATSGTGSAVLFPGADAPAIAAALIRTLALKQDAARWEKIVSEALRSAPAWIRAAEVLDLLAASALAAGASAALTAEAATALAPGAATASV